MNRNALRIALACGAMLALAACGGGDDPMVTLPDSGPAVDGGSTTRDAGTTPRRDGGGGGGTCGDVSMAMGFPPLPAGCVPRCRNATLDAYQACEMGEPGNMCRQTALDSDPTPAAMVEAGGAMPLEVDCAGCFNWQANSCIFDSCPAEAGAYFTCAGMATNPETECATEITALNGCIDANLMAVQGCFGGRAGQCFGAP